MPTFDLAEVIPPDIPDDDLAPSKEESKAAQAHDKLLQRQLKERQRQQKEEAKAAQAQQKAEADAMRNAQRNAERAQKQAQAQQKLEQKEAQAQQKQQRAEEEAAERQQIVQEIMTLSSSEQLGPRLRAKYPDFDKQYLQKLPKLKTVAEVRTVLELCQSAVTQSAVGRLAPLVIGGAGALIEKVGNRFSTGCLTGLTSEVSADDEILSLTELVLAKRVGQLSTMSIEQKLLLAIGSKIYTVARKNRGSAAAAPPVQGQAVPVPVAEPVRTMQPPAPSNDDAEMPRG